MSGPLQEALVDFGNSHIARILFHYVTLFGGEVPRLGHALSQYDRVSYFETKNGRAGQAFRPQLIVEPLHFSFNEVW